MTDRTGGITRMTSPPLPTGVPDDPYAAARDIAATLGAKLNLPKQAGAPFRTSLPFTGDAAQISALAQAATAFALVDIAASLRTLAQWGHSA